MHQPIQDGLEAHLSGRLPAAERQQFLDHLAQCAGCRLEVDALREHAEMMRLLRAPQQLEPAPGFYARVMERVEAQTVPSLWSIFLEPAFGGRLTAAALGLFLVLAGAAWQAPARSVALGEHNPVTVLAAFEMQPASGEDRQRDREVVFANLASYGTGGASASLLPVASE